MNRIKVLIVDDSLLFRETLTKGLKRFTNIEVVGTAADPFDATEKIIELKPDVITLDIEMPKMDGIKFLRKLMPKYPLPVIVISSLKESVFEAMDAGAVEFVAKPDNPKKQAKFIQEIADGIRAASKARIAFKKDTDNLKINLAPEGVRGTVDDKKIIAIGASTGGTEAIFSILTKFSKNMPGIVIVQHMPPGFTKLYADRLNNACELNVQEAKNGDIVAPGNVFLAPGGFNMKVIKVSGKYQIKCDKSEKVNGHRPSVDVLFDSVAKSVEDNAMGVILTGMGTDGAVGLKNIREHHGYTIGQDERSSVVYGMPMAAYTSGAVMIQCPLFRIPEEIIRKLSAW